MTTEPVHGDETEEFDEPDHGDLASSDPYPDLPDESIKQDPEVDG